MEGWGAPQWIVAVVLAVRLVAAPVVRWWVGPRRFEVMRYERLTSSSSPFWMRYGAQLMTDAVIVLLLIWGGFW